MRMSLLFFDTFYFRSTCNSLNKQKGLHHYGSTQEHHGDLTTTIQPVSHPIWQHHNINLPLHAKFPAAGKPNTTVKQQAQYNCSSPVHLDCQG